MMNLFYMGGPLFMGVLTIIFVAMITVAIMQVLSITKGDFTGEDIASKLAYIKSIGLLALVVGVLGQLIGLFTAFETIAEMGGIDPGLLAGGLKVSMISTIYGVIIYCISLLTWFGVSVKFQ